MYIETAQQITAEGAIGQLYGMLIEGTHEELCAFALKIIEATDDGPKKFCIDDTKIEIRLIEE